MTVEQQQQQQTEELEKLRATARVLTKYIEGQYEDDGDLITMMIELSDRIGDCANIIKMRRPQTAASA